MYVYMNMVVLFQGYLFGCHLALAWQAFLDLEPFSGPESASFSLVGAPLAFTLQAKPELYKYIEAGKRSIHDVDYSAVSPWFYLYLFIFRKTKQ
jgi:decaprenyl-diphosphate synthase subunit 2